MGATTLSVELIEQENDFGFEYVFGFGADEGDEEDNDEWRLR